MPGRHIRLAPKPSESVDRSNTTHPVRRDESVTHRCTLNDALRAIVQGFPSDSSRGLVRGPG